MIQSSSHERTSFATAVLIAAAVASPAAAGVIHVPGDVPNVESALAQATAGDTVLVSPGPHAGPGDVVLGSGVSLIGLGDWAAGDPFGAAAFIFGLAVTMEEGPEANLIENVWFYSDMVTCNNPAGVIRRCRFGEDLGGLWQDWAIVYMPAGGTLEDSFLYTAMPFPFSFAIEAAMRDGALATIRNNVLNVSADWILAVSHAPGTNVSADVRNNTFSDLGSGLSLIDLHILGGSGPLWFVNNIIEGDIAVDCVAPEPFIAHNCFTVWEHLGGMCAPADSNIVADPLFCGDVNPPEGVHIEHYYLDAASPCIGAGENGTDIGALGVGCGVTGIAGEAPPAPTRLRLAVSPNPVLEGAVFSFDPPPTGDALRLEIYDPLGRLAEVLRPAGPRVAWTPPPSAPRGVYFARLRGRGATEVVKFIVLR